LIHHFVNNIFPYIFDLFLGKTAYNDFYTYTLESSISGKIYTKQWDAE